jgi:nitroreductase
MRAIRKFRPDPGPDALLRRVLEASGLAPSGGNRLPWRFIVLRGEAERKAIKDIILAEAARTGTTNTGADFLDAPVVVIVCAVAPAAVGPGTVGPFGQTYPAIENFLLAARGVGLGSTISTSFKFADSAIRSHLGIPEGFDTTCLLPLGYPDRAQGQRHGRKTRQPIEELAFEGHWGETLRLAQA